MDEYIDFNLDDEQIKPVMDINGYISVIAGAGSGKTRVITARIAYLLQMGVDPYNILAITFTNKAANEMKERIINSTPNGGEIFASTFHSLCAKILRVYGSFVGYDQNFSIYDEEDKKRAVKRILETMDIDSKHKDKYVAHISNAKTYGLTPAQYKEELFYDKDIKVITQVYEAYEIELKRSNALDFDDLLIKCNQLLEDFPQVLSILQDRFKYICVDEFQDTNTLQFNIVKLLSQKYKNLFVVGDEDQSIYSWRGAIVKNMVDFAKIFPGAKTYKLERNYRSTSDILEAANNVISHNTIRNPKKLWTNQTANNSITLHVSDGDRAEADYIAFNIEKLHNQGIPYNEIAILVRINSVSRIYEEKLAMYSIPFRTFGGFRFYERKEIKDALAYVKLATNPKDNESILRIINYPRIGIGQKTIEDLIDLSIKYNLTINEIILNLDKYAPSLKTKLNSFVDIINNLTESIKTMKPDEFMNHVIKNSGLESELSNSKDKDDEDRLENIKELVGAVKEFINDNPESSIQDFVQSATLISAQDEINGDDYVSIATIHAVKGLEFDTVFVAACEEGIFPLERLDSDPLDIEEERRLMYVAITRAKRHLFICCANSRFRYNGYQRESMSKFISEMKLKPELLASQIKSNVGFANTSFNRMNHGYSIQKQSYDYHKTVEKTKPILRTEPSKPKVDFSKFNVGTKVRHQKYGDGEIIEMIGNDEYKVCLIDFPGLGAKKFMLELIAPLLTIIE